MLNPLFLRLGIGLFVAVVTCVATYRNHRKQQAILANEISSFDGGDVTVCCICLKQLSVVKESQLVSLPCKHKFHKNCIKMLFDTKSPASSCPLCRKEVDEAFVATISPRSDF